MVDIRIEADGDVLAIRVEGRELAVYDAAGSAPQLESPRPFLHPVRTLGGTTVTVDRPDDHVWHRGISWALPVVDDENFWGGPTFVDGEYRQLPNDGAQRHRRFTRLDDGAGAARIVEELDWITESGARLIDERRMLVIGVIDEASWSLAFETRMANVSGAPLSLGSPTTRGRENAGYGGLFWRGPSAFAGGTILAPGARGGDELRGRREPWMGFCGRDASGAAATLVFVDDPANGPEPTEWFARTEDYACVCPAPFFSAERVIEAGERMTLRYAVIVADGETDPARGARLAALGTAALAELAEPGAAGEPS